MHNLGTVCTVLYVQYVLYVLHCMQSVYCMYCMYCMYSMYRMCCVYCDLINSFWGGVGWGVEGPRWKHVLLMWVGELSPFRGLWAEASNGGYTDHDGKIIPEMLNMIFIVSHSNYMWL